VSVLAVGQVWTDESGDKDEILSIDEGTDYPVQFRMPGMHSVGRDTVEGFLASHTQPTSWWLAKLDEIRGAC